MTDGVAELLDSVDTTHDPIDNAAEYEEGRINKTSFSSELGETEQEIAETTSNLKGYKKEDRNYLVGLVSMLLLTGVTIYLAIQINAGWWIAVGIFTVVSLLLLLVLLGSSVREAEAKLERLQARKRFLLRFSDGALGQQGYSTSSYFDKLVQINVENLGEYYSLVKIHTNKSFQVSIMAGVFGFLLIMSGLIVSFMGIPGTQGIVYISTASGIVVEIISGIFFYLYNRTVRQLKEYHDSLLAVQNILLSFKIIEGIGDGSERITMVARMLEFLMTKEVIPNLTSAAKPDRSGKNTDR